MFPSELKQKYCGAFEVSGISGKDQQKTLSFQRTSRQVPHHHWRRMSGSRRVFHAGNARDKPQWTSCGHSRSFSQPESSLWTDQLLTPPWLLHSPNAPQVIHPTPSPCSSLPPPHVRCFFWEQRPIEIRLVP